MLRKITLKNREIPIPVPVKTLGDVISWVEDTLLREDAILTSAILEDKELINELYRKSVKDIELNEKSSLHIKIETPKDLSSQSLDVVCDLAHGIAMRIKKMAFNSWQGLGLRSKNDLEELCSDVQLLMDLISHINGLLDDCPIQFTFINKLSAMISAENLNLEQSLVSENWQEIASLLETRLEPHLEELAYEGEKLQIKILTAHLSALG